MSNKQLTEIPGVRTIHITQDNSREIHVFSVLSLRPPFEFAGAIINNPFVRKNLSPLHDIDEVGSYFGDFGLFIFSKGFDKLLVTSPGLCRMRHPIDEPEKGCFTFSRYGEIVKKNLIELHGEVGRIQYLNTYTPRLFSFDYNETKKWFRLPTLDKIPPNSHRGNALIFVERE